jgi:hypothetical protein
MRNLPAPPAWHEPVAILPNGTTYHRIFSVDEDDEILFAACQTVDHHGKLDIVSRRYADRRCDRTLCTHCFSIDEG